MRDPIGCKPNTSLLCSKPSHGSHLTQSTRQTQRTGNGLPLLSPTGPSLFLPRGLCTCCPFCLEYSSPGSPHDLSLNFIRAYYLNTSLSPKHSPPTLLKMVCPLIPYLRIICSMRAGPVLHSRCQHGAWHAAGAQ